MVETVCNLNCTKRQPDELIHNRSTGPSLCTYSHDIIWCRYRLTLFHFWLSQLLSITIKPGMCQSISHVNMSKKIWLQRRRLQAKTTRLQNCSALQTSTSQVDNFPNVIRPNGSNSASEQLWLSKIASTVLQPLTCCRVALSLNSLTTTKICFKAWALILRACSLNTTVSY